MLASRASAFFGLPSAFEGEKHLFQTQVWVEEGGLSDNKDLKVPASASLTDPVTAESSKS